MSTPQARVLVLGLDGGTFDLLDPWTAQGELPFLGSLLSKGMSARLESVYPAKTIPAWYSLATGLDPGALGVFGFAEPDGGPGRSRIVQTFRPAEALWDTLSRHGRRVGIVNFPLRSSYPVNGVMLPGMLTERPRTHPEGLRERLETELGEPLGMELPPFRDAERGPWMREATRLVEQRAEIGELICRDTPLDFLFVLFRETDRVQHQLWSELASGAPRCKPDLREFWRTVDHACERLDTAFRAKGGPVLTLVVSDHGHGPVHAAFFTNQWLARNGFLRFRTALTTGIRRRVTSAVLQGADRWKPVRPLLRATVDRLSGSRPGAAVGRLFAGEGSFESMADRIDWASTVAFSHPVPEGIYLNRRNPKLTPERGERILDDLRTRLASFPHARIESFRPEELYAGRNLASAPDLLLRVDGLETELRMDFAYPEPFLRRRPAYFYGSGVHRMDGILIATGEGVIPGRRAPSLSLLDVAPTVLAAMGVRAAPVGSGRSFVPLLRQADGATVISPRMPTPQ